MGLVVINTSISTLICRVNNMDKRIEKLKSKEGMKELLKEMQAILYSIVISFHKEVQAL